MGPNYSISTACATANFAFVAAANHIRSGDADVMLAGGTEAPIIPVGLGGFVACRCPPKNKSAQQSGTSQESELNLMEYSGWSIAWLAVLVHQARYKLSLNALLQKI